MQRIKIALALIIVVGYFGFEAFNLHRLGYRMEPLYIFDQFASADAAVGLCGNPDSAERARFAHNFLYVTRRAVADLAEQAPAQGGLSPQQAIDARGDQRSHEVALMVEKSGCESPDARRLVKFHEIRARLNLG